MEKFFKLDEQYTILARWQKTRSAFKHTASLFDNGNKIGETKICYLNRTWESYEYESVVEKIIDLFFKGEQKDKYVAAAKAIGSGEVNKAFASVKALVGIAEILGADEAQRNRLKKVSLASLPGIEFPDDFDSLPEAEKKRRLDAAAKVI